MKTLRLFGLLISLMGSALVAPAWAGNSVLIWPIDPKIPSGDKATELWLENRGEATTLMQVGCLPGSRLTARNSIRRSKPWLPARRW